jgi:hypothetical protein
MTKGHPLGRCGGRQWLVVRVCLVNYNDITTFGDYIGNALSTNADVEGNRHVCIQKNRSFPIRGPTQRKRILT